jgi:uncharacterized protein (DUF302 family)
VAYAYKAVSKFNFIDSVHRLLNALKKRHMNVVDHINVRDRLMHDHCGDIGHYTIIGACNPHVAKEAIRREPGIGVLMPCNFSIYEVGGKTLVSCVLTTKAVKLTKNKPLMLFAVLMERNMKNAVDEAAGKANRLIANQKNNRTF